MRSTAASPWFLIPLCLGSGALISTAITGIPKLWSAEAAGWASAIGTTLAAVVALFVGVVPEINRRREAEIRSFVQMSLAVSDLETQLLHVNGAIVESRNLIYDFATRKRLVDHMDFVNPAGVQMLLSFAEHLPPKVLTATTGSVSDMQRVASLMRKFSGVDPAGEIEGGDWMTSTLVLAHISMNEARVAMTQALGREVVELPDVPDEVKRAERRAA